MGSDANFITMQSIAPEGRAKGTMNLDSDPKNPPRNAAICLKNEFIEVPLGHALMTHQRINRRLPAPKGLE